MLIRLLVLAPLFALTTTAPGAAPAAQSPGVRVIEIAAERFEFWPSQVVVAQGEEVELRLRSFDTIHGFRIIGAGTNLVIPKRGKGYATARFTGAVPGRYTFECNRMCGAGHDFMRGELIVRATAGGAGR